MSTVKRWSRTVGPRRGNRIRFYEREPGGKLYAAVWDPERHKYTQTGLGHRDRERALRDVGELVRLRESGDDLSGPLKLGTMVARYLAESIHTRDGSLKTAQYMKGCAQFATYLIEWFGAETPVSQLTPDRMRSEEHTSELQSPCNLVCRLLLEKKKNTHCESAFRSVRFQYVKCQLRGRVL